MTPADSPHLETTTSPRAKIVLAVLVVAYAIFFAWLTLTRFAAHESRALDMGNLNQAVWNTAHGNWFHQTNQPGSTNRLSLHVEPIILPISLLYWLHDGAETLLILQAVVVALGALPVFALARRKLLPAWMALLLAAAWLLMPAIQSANWLEFHPLTLAPTFLMAAFYFLIARRAGWYALFAVLAAACKEDLGLVIAMLGVYAFLVQKMRWTGVLSVVLGAGWALFAVLWVQRQFGDNIHWGRYAWLGDSPGAMMRGLVTRPDLVFAQLRQANVLLYFFKLLLPVGFIALLAPEVLLLALPSLAINLLADFPPMHEVDGLIYAAPIAPFVMLAAVMGMARLWQWTAARSSHPARWLATALLLAGMALGQVWYGYLPGAPNYKHFVVTAHDRRAQAVISQIDPADRVSSQDKLNPHVSGRTTSHIFPEANLANADQLDAATRAQTQANAWLVDTTGPAWPQHPNDVHATVQELLAEGAGIAAAADGYLLLRTGAEADTPDEAFYSAWRSPVTTPAFAQQARFGDDLELLGYSITNDPHGELVVDLYWRALRPLEEDFAWLLRYVNEEGVTEFDSLYYQPVAALWYPTSLWQPGESVLVQSLPWAYAGDALDLLVGVYRGADVNDRLLIDSELSPAQTLLEDDTLLHLGTFERVRTFPAALLQGAQWQLRQDPAATPQDARFGDLLALTAAHSEAPPRANDALRVQLEWRVLADPAGTWNLRLFLHLLNDEGSRVAQLDTQPMRGNVATDLAWLDAGDELRGYYTVALPSDLPAGSYTLTLGVYDWTTGERLPASGANLLPDNAVLLGTIPIAP